MMSPSRFRKIILDYYRTNPRAPMPWRRVRDRRDPYRILISEIMLQQTQVARVTPFYENFIKKFPDFKTLAHAKTPDVLRAWQGLGYNRRALALKKLASKVVEEYGGRLPREAAALVALPGIGPYTVGAVRAFAFNEPEIFIETNIRRVFIHFFFPDRAKNGGYNTKVTDAALRRYIERTIDRNNPREWYWALMDYGAMLGEKARRTDPSGTIITNANHRSAHYTRQSKFAGSDREIRGKIVREVLSQPKVSSNTLIMAIAKELNTSPQRVSKIFNTLAKEGFIKK